MYQCEHLLIIISVNLSKRSAYFKAAIRFETWNGVLGTMRMNNECSYLQRQRVPSTQGSYSKKNCRT